MVSVAIFAAIVLFAVRYRRRRGVVAEQIEGSTALEITWSAIPLGIFIVIFLWGAVIYFRERTPPRGATEVYVVAKQWMWKLQHEEGQREINELHVPVGRDVKMILTSQDVIHSFYVPAFRIKQDVLPGRYTTAWFRPTKAGIYHLFCAEYCGSQHSGMIGQVVVLEPAQYRGLAQRRRRLGIDGIDRSEYVPAAGLLHLPPLGYPGPRPRPGRPLRQAGATGRRTHGIRLMKTTFGNPF